jgi:aminopeptidase N
LVTQHCPPTPNQATKEPFHIPVGFALVAPNGRVTDEQTLIVDQPEHRFTFSAKERPVVSLLRDFSAPIKLVFDQSKQDLAHLVKYDNNGFVRFEAIQRMALNLLLPAIRNEEFDVQDLNVLIDTFKHVLENPPPDQAMLAELLSLPSESYLVDSLATDVDPIKVSSIRKKLMQALAKALSENLLEHYQRCAPVGNFSLDSTAMARRALRNKTLAWLMFTDSPESLELTLKHFAEANTMTEQQAALACLVFQGGQKSQEAVESFYQQWKNEPLVLDKWFAIQASSPSQNSVELVKGLLEHSAFSIKNPNKVRSLLGAFSSNLSGFHSPGGHQLLASQIILLNDINPQVAARLVGSFNNWRMFKAPVQESMRAELERISAIPNLTTDISEIVGKALA